MCRLASPRQLRQVTVGEFVGSEWLRTTHQDNASACGMFLLRFEPMPNRRSGQVRDGDYSCRMSPLREPMPSEPSRTGGATEDGTDEEVSATAGAAKDCAAAV